MLRLDDGVPARVVRDVHGRSYRVGETDSQLIGRSRLWMIRLPLVSMIAISLFEYGFGAAVPALTRTYGWSLGEAFAVLAVWVVFQAGVCMPAVRLYRRIGDRLVAPMVAGATLCLLALVTLAHTGQLAAVLLGYSMLGGIGAGLVYTTCIATVTEWFPERTAPRVGIVSGAFSYGAIPFVVVTAYVLGVNNHAPVLDIAAVGVFIVLGVSGLLMSKPPLGWWPAHIDPQLWAIDRRLNRSIPNNVPATRPYPTRAAFRSGMLTRMLLIMALASTLTLFDIAYLAAWATSTARPLVVAAVIGVLALSGGIGRAAASSLSDRLGRQRTLRVAMALGGFAQLGLLAGVHGRQLAAVAVFAALAGAGAATAYPLLVGLVRDWFGEEANLANYGIVYTAKAVGGPLGIGLAGLAVISPRPAAAFVVAGCLGLLGATLVHRMRQPGRPALPAPRLVHGG